MFKRISSDLRQNDSLFNKKSGKELKLGCLKPKHVMRVHEKSKKCHRTSDGNSNLTDSKTSLYES